MFKSFKTRSTQSELMDDPRISYDDFHDCLKDLETVNQWTLAYRPTKIWLGSICKRKNRSTAISILDVGSGGGDSLRMIARWMERRQQPVKLMGLDLNPWSQAYAQHVTPNTLNITFETADIFSIEKHMRVDYVMSSLFTHHLDDEHLIRFLQWMEHHTHEGWFINDLHRHPLAYFSFTCLARLCRFHYMVQHDGPISVARAFSKKNWIDLLHKAQIPLEHVEIHWYFPFRYCLIRHKS